MKMFKKEGETAQTFLVRDNTLNHLIDLNTLFIKKTNTRFVKRKKAEKEDSQ